MRVLVTGSRDWTDPKSIRREFLSLLNLALRDFQMLSSAATLDEMRDRAASSITVINGAARGADQLAGQIADEMGFGICDVPAQWEKYGKRAGPLRNEQMLREFGPIDLVLAFHEDLAKSKGTKDMVNRALRDGIPVKIIPQ